MSVDAWQHYYDWLCRQDACGLEKPARNASVNISIVKEIAAFRAELRRMGGIFRLPAAFIALIEGRAGRLL